MYAELEITQLTLEVPPFEVNIRKIAYISPHKLVPNSTSAENGSEVDQSTLAT